MFKLSLTLACCFAALGCRQAREQPSLAPVYDRDVESLLQARCGRCHAGQDAGAGWFRVGSYMEAIACAPQDPDGAAADAGGPGAELVSALEREDHRQLLASDEAARLRAWVRAGAPLRERALHRPGILNPRSADWHGVLAARDHFGLITRADHPDVCGRCHEGAPVRPQGVSRGAQGAPDCSSCHRQAQGVLACGTCHGDGAERAAPPRDACLFPDAGGSAHRVHLESTRLGIHTLTCSTCHGALPEALGGRHGDGKLDVVFDAAQAGEDASYDPETGRCSVSCHNRAGARPTPSFTESGPLGCADCHGAPPVDHYAGSCDRCHAGVDAKGSALLDTRAHMDGTRGPGEACGTCHGNADDPLPRSPSHQLHRDTILTRAIECRECHPVPERGTSEGHLDRAVVSPVDVLFGPLARARGRSPSYRQARCSDVACHGAGLPEMLETGWTWNAPTRSESCSGCHGLPPGVQHTADNHCASLVCHGAEISAASDQPAITEAGRARHIDGRYDTTQR